MSTSEVELAKMVRGFRVADLQSLLLYAGRNKNGKKPDLQAKALDLIRLRSAAIDMKIREIHMQKFSQSRNGGPASEPEMYQMPPMSAYNSNRPMRTSHQRHMRNPAIPGYMPNMNKHIVPPPTHLNDRYEQPQPQYPMNPDVKFKVLPFYDVLDVLLKPVSLITLANDRFKESEFPFCLQTHHVQELQSDPDVQVQLRICLLDTREDQDDELPASVCIKTNHIVVSLPNVIPTNKPGVDPKRPKKPVDITHLIKRTDTEPNVITISWASSTGKPYVLGIFLVRQQTSAVLIRRLKANGVRNPDHTTAMIKEKLCQDRDSEIASMSLKGSLICPLGKIRMPLPSRATTCTHLQCFDATLYLQMNEKKPKWICPVCHKPALFKDLAIDGLFLDIIQRVPGECKEVEFHEDGSWTPVVEVKKAAEISDAVFDSTPASITTVTETSGSSKKKEKKKQVEVIDLDSDSDTEDSWVRPPKKKIRPLDISPVLLESPEDTRHSLDLKMEHFNPYLPSTSKAEILPAKSSLAIPEKSSLAPLPDELHIEVNSSDVDCILGDNSPTPGGAGPSSGYENISPVNSPDVYSPPSDPFLESATAAEALQKSQESTRHFTNFNLFSLIQPNQESYYNVTDGGDTSPDVIDID
ncbi:hypothetical protein JTE90_007678 [Oedothorax gibbosus]|uniref:E3 SUMO-protein ligase PIAS3 n=1 Tax=Oedothorax gibbosus TaxID=931172 RepID=A0AAV6UKA6_9ARAC|nr:hypothetical protein JTE90_007678 [Oedothorax gibbosus]